MSYIGKTPTPAPLTSSDITDGIISTSKLADTSVTNAKINADIISAETELATAPADTDELLISDAGVLKRIDASLIGGGGITVADEWYVSSSFTLASTGTNTPITANWTRNNNGHIGTNLTESSGVFTFPSTGIYLIRFQHSMYRNGDNRQAEIRIETSTDSGSSFGSKGSADAFIQQTSSNNTHISWNLELLQDITNVSTNKVRFAVQHVSGSVTNYAGKGRIQAQFIRLGDT